MCWDAGYAAREAVRVWCEAEELLQAEQQAEQQAASCALALQEREQREASANSAVERVFLISQKALPKRARFRKVEARILSRDLSRESQASERAAQAQAQVKERELERARQVEREICEERERWLANKKASVPTDPCAHLPWI